MDTQLPDPQHLAPWTEPVLRGVADFPRGSAPGPSGLRPSCLYDMLKRGPHVSTLTYALAQFVAICAHGLFPADLAPPLAAANLIPLRKPDGGVRPIAIGETLRRLVGKVLMNNPSLAKLLRELVPQQCGVGITNACESIGQGLQDLVSAMPERGDWVVVQVDVTNAFNTIDRTAVLKGSAEHAPPMYAWLRFLYAQPTSLFSQGKCIVSRTGVHQGCPLGPAAFACAIQTIVKSLEQFALQWGVFYLDDGLLVGPLSRVELAFRFLCDSMLKLGLTINQKKYAIWGPGAELCKSLPTEHPLFQVPQTGYEAGTGVKMLGVPVGRPGETTYQDKQLETKIVALEKACHAITGVPDPQLQHCLLRQCLDACKLQFFLRTTPCDGTTAKGLLARADEAFFGVMEEMVGGGLHLEARQQASLPFSEGGCGIRVANNVKGPARISSLVGYLLQGKKRVGVPDLAQDILPCDLPNVLNDLKDTLGENFDPIQG